MKPSQFWWLQILSISLLTAMTFFPHREGLQTIIMLALGLTRIVNSAMDRPETQHQQLMGAAIFFALIAISIPFAWGKPVGWIVLALFPIALFSLVKLLRSRSTTQTQLTN
jgi:hypothetical protein